MVPTVVCVQKVVKVDLATVQLLHLPTVVMQPTVFVTQDVLETTAQLCATTEDQVVLSIKHNHMEEPATWQADSAV